MIVEQWIKDLAGAPAPQWSGDQRLWSIWNMLRLHAHDFIESLRIFEGMRNVLIDVRGRFPGQALTPAVGGTILADLDRLQKHIDLLELGLTAKACDRLRRHIASESHLAADGIEHFFDDIQRRMRDELEDRLILRVAPDKQRFFEPAVPIFGSDVDLKFPSAAFDVSEAGKCFALGRSTACVMHLMRALETPFQLLVTDLVMVAPTRDNWGGLLQLIEPIIATLPASDDRKLPYAEAALQFRFYKDAWRNECMHARSKYTEDEATPIFAAVGDTMKTLAKRLQE